MKITRNKLLLFFLMVSTFGCDDKDDFEEFAENIFTNSVSLTTQAQVNKFALNNYTKIDGGLIIGQFYEENVVKSDITDLTPLRKITEITGNLSIQNLDINNLNGLHNITSVGSLQITSNSVINDLSLFDNLKITNTLTIFDCQSLTKLPKLPNVNSLDYLGIGKNNSLIDLNFLNNLTTVSKIVVIIENLNLSSINGLNSLTTVEGFDFIIQSNPNLVSFKGLKNLNRVYRLTVWHNGIRNFEGLENLETVENSLSILGNNNLTSVNNLSKLKFIGTKNNNSSSIFGLFINSNKSLISLKGLENIEFFDGYVSIDKNNNLQNLCDLKSILSNTVIELSITENLHNPTEDEIINQTNCSI